MTKRIQFEGRTYEFPDDATDEEIAAALSREPASTQQNAPPPLRAMGAGEDAARSGTSGLHQGATAIPGLPGDMQNLGDEAVGVVQYWALRASGKSDEEARAQVQATLDASRLVRQAHGTQFATGQQFNDAALSAEPESVREWTDHEPQTTAGEYARTFGQFAPGALIPGSAAARAMRVAVPAATSETAGQIARQVAPEHETAARVAGALGSAVGTELGIARAAQASERAAAAAQARNAGQAEARALEQEWAPMTAGERARDPRAVQREYDLRRGGPAEAQRTLRDFDDTRAAQLEQNLMRRVATRGLEPTTDSVGSAGVMLADELRGQIAAMETEQAARYARATELAGAQPVAPTDELRYAVNRVIEENFLDAGPSAAVIDRLSAQINSGQATYATVERARQALNRQLGAAMRSGDDAQSYAIRRIIDELDAFAEPRLAGEAAQAIAEARAYTREMLSMYGEQARPNLATGHVGRRDPGGAVIQRVVETDLTGEQVIDAIFGASSRPPQSALGAVQRIKDRATTTISSGGYEAPTGAASGRAARDPGRTSMRGGRATQGGRRFDPSPKQQERFGVELPKTELQALREAFVYRLRRPLSNRNAGDSIPAQTMATNLRQALHGPGAELTRTIFNETEIATMERALQYLEQVAPPSATFTPSAPGIARDAAERSFAAIASRLIGKVPGIGPTAEAIGDAVRNSRAVNEARRAVAPPLASPAPRTPTRPTPLAPALAGANSDRERR